MAALLVERTCKKTAFGECGESLACLSHLIYFVKLDEKFIVESDTLVLILFHAKCYSSSS